MKYVAVFGSTGAQGSAVVEEAIAQKLKVRAIARSEHRILEKFQDKVDAFEADLLDLDSIVSALHGVDAAFAYLPIPTDPTQPQIFLRNLIEAAHRAKLPLLVFTTSGPTGSRYDLVPMIAGATAARDAVLNSDISSIVLQPTVYLENLQVPLFVPRLYRAGVLDYPPIRQTQRLGWVSHTDQAKYAIAGFLQPELAGKAYEIFSPGSFTGADIANVLSSWMGKEVQFEATTPRAFGDRIAKALNNQGVGEALSGLYEAISKLPDDEFDASTHISQQTFGVKLSNIAQQVQSWSLETKME